MEIRITSVSDAGRLSRFYRENAEHLREWEPLRSPEYHSESAWRDRLKDREWENSKGISAHFILVDPQEDQVIAICSLTNIVYEPFWACNIGYSVALSYQGKGFMKRLCVHAIEYAFEHLKLNRVMANYMPCNARSEVLLHNLGFNKEGLARNYLKINGRWEDHVLTSLLNPANL